MTTLKHLQQTALRLGIEVPYFFSGMHHGHDPAEDTKDLFDPNRPSPWLSTEFWSVWFDKYGSGQPESDVFGRRTWKIITRGGNGYNVYMAHGGSNFGYTNDDEDAASYDYGAAVGQTGDLRPMYYQFKRNARFARSFEDILENSSATHQFDGIATEGDLSVVARTSGKGDIISLDNGNAEESRVTYLTIEGKSYPSAGKLVLDPSEILPLVHRFSLTENVTIDWAITRVLGIQKTEHTTTVVVYGKIGSYGDILFTVNGPVTVQSDPAAFDTTGKRVALQLTFSGNKPNVYSFNAGNEVIRVVAVDAIQADRTWFMDENGVTCVVVGPEYIGDIRKENGRLHITCERPWYPASTPSANTWVYDDAGEKILGNGPVVTQRPDQLGFTGDWVARDGDGPAALHYDDRTWLAGKWPLQMGADGDTSAYAWYRTTIHLPADGLYSLDISKGHGRYIVFLDGKKASGGNGRALSFTARKGTHTLAIFSTHDGRDKLVSYVGKLDVDEKGLAGQVTLHNGPVPLLTHWKFLPVADSEHIPPSFQSAVDYRAGADAFAGKRGYGWFHLTLPTVETVPDSILFSGVDDNAVVYINGRKAGEQRGWGIPFSVPFPKAIKRDTSAIDVFIGNKDGQGGLGAKIKAVYHEDISLTGWRMKGGPGSFEESPLSLNASEIGSPVFYKNHFAIDGIPDNVHPMWRVTFEGLSHGFIWVNGHNLGRYPEVIPIDGLYVPECWLNKGQNEVIIFDEYGKSPAKVKIKAEQMASRDAYEVREDEEKK
jgi:beta-galactosidase